MTENWMRAAASEILNTEFYELGGPEIEKAAAIIAHLAAGAAAAPLPPSSRQIREIAREEIARANMFTRRIAD